ncbi:MAG TPA: hypothetical protein VH281_04050 [Gaiellaceae bacterium]
MLLPLLGVLVVAAGGAHFVAPSRGGPDLIRTTGNEAAPDRGAWRGQAGLFEPYRHGAHLAVLFTVKNMTEEEVTLVSVEGAGPGPRLLRRIGVRFALVEQLSEEDVAHILPGPGLGPPFGAVEPSPLAVPPAREAQVQLNFVIDDCRYFSPGERATYNQAATLRYRIGDAEKTVPIDLTGDQVTIKAPAEGDCPSE